MSAHLLPLKIRVFCSLIGVLLFPALLRAQDTRTVNEPTFPATCTALAAAQSISNGEPTSETSFDTGRIQSALNACGAGNAVELTLGGTSNVFNAFLIQPITIPTGVTLIVDGGVTVFASRNPADYQSTASGVETCGTVGTAGNGCAPLITINNNAVSSGAGIMGYGVINGRGGDDLIVNGVVQTYSWWNLATQANTGSNAQNNFILMYPKYASNFTLYKITLMNSPMFHVKYQYGSGFTVWGLKIITPYSSRNTDGIDPDDTDTNITINNSYISDGDDDVALGATSGHPVQDVTIENTHTYDGHGLSIGSNTAGGVSNVYLNNIAMSGNLSDSNSAGLKIKSAENEGGVVNNVSYNDVCIQNIRYPIQFNPFYSSSTGTEYPSFQNIGLHNVTIATNPNSTIELDGLNANFPLGLTMDNLNITGTFGLTPAPQYANITLGPGPVTPASLQTSTGTGVTYTGSITNPTEAAFACPATSFPFLAGELYLSTSALNNQQSLTLTQGGSFTLNAVLEVTEASKPAPTQPVVFYEGSTVLGTGTLSSNGTLASLTLSNVTPGAHTYTAAYSVSPYTDANYAALNFGSVTVAANAAATTTTIGFNPATAPYGEAVNLTGTVNTGTDTTLATGTITFYDGATRLAGVTIVNDGNSFSITTLSTGTHNIVASYSGDSNYAGSSSASTPLVITQASTITSLTPSNSTVPYGMSESFITVVSGAYSGSPTGTVTFMDGTTSLGTQTLSSGTATLSLSTLSAGSHSITIVYGGDSNFIGSTSQAVSVTVTPAATSVAVTSSAAQIYANESETLTATVTSAAGAPATGMVTFSNGSTMLGTGTVTGGVASVTLTNLVAGSYSVTVTFAASGNYAASTSAAVALTVVAPVALALTPASISLAAGMAGTSNVTITPQQGFTGAVTVTSSSPVSYITCTASSPVTITGTTAGTATINVSVAATAALSYPRMREESRTSTVLASLLPFGALLLIPVVRRRKYLMRLLALLLLALGTSLTVSGCSGGGSGNSAGPTLPPAGADVVTITATANGAAMTTTLTVNVTN